MDELRTVVHRAIQIYHTNGLISLFDAAVGFLKRGIRQPLYRNRIIWERKKNRIRQRCSSETDADPLKLVWIDPQRIKYCTGSIGSGPTSAHLDHVDSFHGTDMFGSVKNGDWDQSDDLVSDIALYQAINRRIKEDIDWNETEFYQRHVKLIAEQGESFSCQSEAELQRNCEWTDSIIEDIMDSGYKTQHALGTEHPLREICVNIGRDGEFLFNGGGRHRLAIAQALEVESVPVLIKVRHTRWQSIRNEIRTADTLESLSNEARQHINHPDLEDIVPSAWVD